MFICLYMFIGDLNFNFYNIFYHILLLFLFLLFMSFSYGYIGTLFIVYRDSVLYVGNIFS